MNALAVLSGAALCVAAYAFHWRARLLAGQSHGWPAAPLPVRLAIDAAALTLLLAGMSQIATGKIPLWLQCASSVVMAGYAVTFAVNIGQQRGTVTADPDPKIAPETSK